jgi:hypothetical protein
VNDRIHAGIAALSAVFVVATLAVRWAVTPVRDTAPSDDDHDTVVTPIAELMSVGEWEQEPVYGIALELARGERT